jgi:regulatory protein YycI of two-component signal transduction system YycFG
MYTIHSHPNLSMLFSMLKDSIMVSPYVTDIDKDIQSYIHELVSSGHSYSLIVTIVEHVYWNY